MRLRRKSLEMNRRCDGDGWLDKEDGYECEDLLWRQLRDFDIVGIVKRVVRGGGKLCLVV